MTPVAETLPVFETVNLVTPDADAVIRSPLFVLFTISAALPPMPPDTESGAITFAVEPILTPESKSEVRMVLPLPNAVMVRLLLPVVVISGVTPPWSVKTPPLKLVVPVVPIVPNPSMVLPDEAAEILPIPVIA